ncbi:hypothetical protein ACFQY5_01255 [Paeniroseomonas aquatica]
MDMLDVHAPGSRPVAWMSTVSVLVFWSSSSTACPAMPELFRAVKSVE